MHEINDYLKRTGLPVRPAHQSRGAGGSRTQAGLSPFSLDGADACLKRAEAILRSDDITEAPLSYPVPRMTPEGTCSSPEELDPEAYDISAVLSAQGFGTDELIRFVARMDALVAYLHAEAVSDWTGIYKKLAVGTGDALVKIAYRGRPSRAEFPLTESFASHSNNSTVGLSGLAVLVSSVRRHRDEGKPYYECDDEVQSELCVPIFSADGAVSGIIDLESFQENHFDEEKILATAAVCVALGRHL